jgi:hypothetical protein
MSINIEKFNQKFDFFENIAKIAFLLLLLYYLWCHRDSISFNPDHILAEESAKIVITLRETTQTLAKNDNPISNKPLDNNVPNSELIKTAETHDSLTNIIAPSTSWVYVGDIFNGKVTTDNFSLGYTKMRHLKVGDEIKATVPIFKRLTLPVPINEDSTEWKFGEIKGVVKKNENIKVIAVSIIPDSIFYVLVQ